MEDAEFNYTFKTLLQTVKDAKFQIVDFIFIPIDFLIGNSVLKALCHINQISNTFIEFKEIFLKGAIVDERLALKIYQSLQTIISSRYTRRALTDVPLETFIRTNTTPDKFRRNAPLYDLSSIQNDAIILQGS